MNLINQNLMVIFSITLAIIALKKETREKKQERYHVPLDISVNPKKHQQIV